MKGTKRRPEKQFDGLSLARLFLAPSNPDPKDDPGLLREIIDAQQAHIRRLVAEREAGR
jgi:hypothetical protein